MAFLTGNFLNISQQTVKYGGLKEGRVEGKIETAKNILAEGLNIKMISHITGLSVSEVEKL